MIALGHIPKVEWTKGTTFRKDWKARTLTGITSLGVWESKCDVRRKMWKIKICKLKGRCKTER